MPSTRANGSGFFTVDLTESEPLPVSAGAGRHELAGRVGDSLRGHAKECLRKQPDLGRGAGAVGPDVGVADLLAAGAFGPGLPQPNPAGPAIARPRDSWPQRLAADAAVALTTRDRQRCEPDRHRSA